MAEFEYGEKALGFLQRPIQPWIDDPDATEIVFNRPGEVGVERKSRWSWYPLPEMDPQMLDAFGLRAGARLAKPFDPAHPICLTELPGKIRATFIRSPVVQTVCASFRVPSRGKHSMRDPSFRESFDAVDDDLGQRTAIDEQMLQHFARREVAEFFPLAVKSKKTIATVGEPGSGKTRLIKTMMRGIGSEERVATIEDTPEFGEIEPDQDHGDGTARLRNRVEMIFGSAGVTATDCIEATFRMRPDRVAIQELRGSEIWAYHRLLVGGYAGSFTSWHGARDRPFAPLVAMCAQTSAGAVFDPKAMEADFRHGIDIIVFCHKNKITNRYTNEIIWYKDAEYAAT